MTKIYYSKDTKQTQQMEKAHDVKSGESLCQLLRVLSPWNHAGYTLSMQSEITCVECYLPGTLSRCPGLLLGDGHMGIPCLRHIKALHIQKESVQYKSQCLHKQSRHCQPLITGGVVRTNPSSQPALQAIFFRAQF